VNVEPRFPFDGTRALRRAIQLPGREAVAVLGGPLAVDAAEVGRVRLSTVGVAVGRLAIARVDRVERGGAPFGSF
jgi:hypothetical protein